MSQEKNILQNENNNASGDKSNYAEKKKRLKKADILVFVACIIAAVAIWAYASNIERKEEAEKISKGDIPTKEDISEIVGDLNKNETVASETVQ